MKLWKNKEPSIGLAIAGGGCKAFFALGVAESFRREGFHFSAVSATSAGTAMGIAVINQKADEAVDYFCELTARNPSNFNLKRLLSGENPFPHEQMYRETIAKIIDIKTFSAICSASIGDLLKTSRTIVPLVRSCICLVSG